jgi:hypothetical protein
MSAPTCIWRHFLSQEPRGTLWHIAFCRLAVNLTVAFNFIMQNTFRLCAALRDFLFFVLVRHGALVSNDPLKVIKLCLYVVTCCNMLTQHC